MAALIVRTQAHPTLQVRFLQREEVIRRIEQTGRDMTQIEASVEAAGSPVTGLARSNFDLLLLATPSQGITGVTIEFVFEEDLPGFYGVLFSPEGAKKLTKGAYICGLAVNRKSPSSRGSSLVQLRV